MTLKASFLYFLITFVVAFVLGVIRVMFVVPIVGELVAVLIEVPLMIFVSWKVFAWVMPRYFSNRPLQDYFAVGLIAFLFLMVTEYVLALFAFDRTSAEFISSLQTGPGLIGLVGQVGFAFVPLIQRKMSTKLTTL